ncbi:MAG: hypothetical protein ACI3W5_13920 [Faecousia sp.]
MHNTDLTNHSGSAKLKAKRTQQNKNFVAFEAYTYNKISVRQRPAVYWALNLGNPVTLLAPLRAYRIYETISPTNVLAMQTHRAIETM